MKTTILIIDDDEAILRALSRLLSPDHVVVCFSDPCAAIKYTKLNNVNLVICDLLMPTLNGLTVLKEIRLIQPHCSRMLLTGYAELEATKHAIYKNIANIITAKPWDNFELTMIINLLIENSFLRANQYVEKES
ncbi:response regulator [Pseudoalteromonas sp. APAL1]|uniref:response regulator n=1 Tax=Pseudoalteromonas sp. APAL1 TaxID=2908883 RepID=UPI001F250929|nr:response regulator [Pseudoalteromonas sp. APAL1]MCF2921364.1 response regulator [Pseudoalteromonas sp. APAL1]